MNVDDGEEGRQPITYFASPHGATKSFPFLMKFNCTLEQPVDAYNLLFGEGEGGEKNEYLLVRAYIIFFLSSSPPLSVLGAHPRCAPPFETSAAAFYDGIH